MHFRSPLAALALAALLTADSSPAQQLLNRSVDVQGVTREFLVYLPASYDGITDLPVMLVFHGGGMNPTEMLQLVDMRPLADQEGFIPVYPAGLRDSNGDRVWDTTAGPYSNGVDELGFTTAMIDSMDSEFAMDRSRVYACGYSNGANLVWELAAFLSDEICAIGPVAGSMWTWIEPLATPTRPVPVISIHGTADFYNPWDGNQYSMGLIAASEYWANHNQANPVPTIVDMPNINQNDRSTVDRYRWADGDQSVHVEHYKVVNGGHDWPGLGGGWKGGNQDINGTELIWEFCSQYSLNGRIQPLMELSTSGPVIAGSTADLAIEFASPNSLTFLAYGLDFGSTLIPPLDLALNLSNPSQLGRPVASDPAGNAAWSLFVPRAASGVTVYLQACQFQSTSNVLRVQVQ